MDAQTKHELEDLKQLYQDGLLTQDDFEKQKENTLNKWRASQGFEEVEPSMPGHAHSHWGFSPRTAQLNQRQRLALEEWKSSCLLEPRKSPLSPVLHTAPSSCSHLPQHALQQLSGTPIPTRVPERESATQTVTVASVKLRDKSLQ